MKYPNLKTLNEFLKWVASNDVIHDHMDRLTAMEMRLQEELTQDKVRVYFGVVTAARSYCEDARYNKIEVVDRYFKSLHSQCVLMLEIFNKNKQV